MYQNIVSKINEIFFIVTKLNWKIDFCKIKKRQWGKWCIENMIVQKVVQFFALTVPEYVLHCFDINELKSKSFNDVS